MPHRSDEALFAAFQRHRDCHALAILFHRRADELLRLAVFLAPRPSDAEDLVQGTFLSAIARAETFRDGNRVMSWLCGILTNHARMLRRAERRPRPELFASTSEDPAHAALRSELRSALDRGIAALPEPYRSVLTLHLENGLDSQEISQRLARPPATVRKQMERAIERLRLALPIGLATAFVARTAPAQLARHAADAARFVDAEPAGVASASLPGGLRSALPVCAIAAVALLAVCVWPLPRDAAASAASLAPSASPDLPTPTAVVAPVAAPAASAPQLLAARTALPTGSLTVRAIGPDELPCADVDILLVRDDGMALPERLLCRQCDRARTGADGRAEFAGLAPGRYDVALPGAPVKQAVNIAAEASELRFDVAAAMPISGVVTGPDGRAVAGADVFASESSCRGDIGVAVAQSAADGSFRGSVRLASGRVFARHKQFGPGGGVRLERDRSLRLELEPARRTIAITVRATGGEPLAGCYVAIAPRSFGTSFYAPLHGRTDAAGVCSLPDPGEREASVIVSRPGFAPAAVDLGDDATAIEVRLTTGARVDGRLVDAAGQALGRRDVAASMLDLRSNEPGAPLLARQAVTGDDGVFSFPNLPAGTVQVRVYSEMHWASGLLALPCVLAGTDVVLAEGGQHQLELQANVFASIRSRLQRPDGSGIGGWNVIAVPDQGTAAHRAFRTRGASTRADGSFEVPGLAAGERYQLGVFPPGAPRRREHCYPVATSLATPGDAPSALVVDTAALPRAMLRCRVLGPDGKPCPGAELELRPVALQAPSTRSAAADGSAEFGPLAAGDYWLAVAAPGLGTRTLVVPVADQAQDVDAGTVQLEPAARLCVRVLCGGRGAPGDLRVLAQNELGDKFVTAATDARGFAMLPPLPPGRTRVLVHGAGIAPVQQFVAAPSGIHWIDVDTTAAPTVPITFDFQPADNPFLVNGPLHVAVRTERGELVFEDYVGAVSERGRFDVTTGLLPGRYRVVARALWGARAAVELDVGGDVPMAPVVATLRL